MAFCWRRAFCFGVGSDQGSEDAKRAMGPGHPGIGARVNGRDHAALSSARSGRSLHPRQTAESCEEVRPVLVSGPGRRTRRQTDRQTEREDRERERERVYKLVKWKMFVKKERQKERKIGVHFDGETPNQWVLI